MNLQALGCSSDPSPSFDAAPLEALDEDPSLTLIQTPPVKVMISDPSGNHLIGMVATQTAVGGFSAQTEYWNAQKGLSFSGDLLFRSVAFDGDETERELSDWLFPLEPSFSTPRIVRQTDWQRGAADMPAGLNQYLFWMQHPDNDRDVLGLLLVVEPQITILGSPTSKLVAAAWYRSSAPTTDGLAFRTPGFMNRLELVVDRDGLPSTDPNIIMEADWHHVVMPLR